MNAYGRDSVYLPAGPLRDQIERHIAALNRGEDRRCDRRGASTLAARCAVRDHRRNLRSWERQINRLRYGQYKAVGLGDADVILTVVDDGTRLDDLWPDWDAAVEAGRRARRGNSPDPPRREPREPVSGTCEGCGGPWTANLRNPGRRRRFCTIACSNRYAGSRRTGGYA